MWTDTVKRWLTEQERTQAWLARRAGMSDSQLNHYLAGRHKAGARVLQKLDRAMGLPPGTLYGLRSQGELALEEARDGRD